LLLAELASVLVEPSVGHLFAELGATVVKIENLRTRGDVTRSWRLASEASAGEVSAYFAAANWGKQSVCADLSSAMAKDAVYAIIEKADAVLVSFKPGDAEKLGMDYATLSARNPRLLYGQITGYGPQVRRAGYDAVLQAEAGFMYLNGEKGGGPVKMPVAMIDIIAAHQLKEGLLAALYVRERTGRGQYVEVSLLGAAISALANQATNYLVAGVTPQRMGSEHPNIVPYGTVFKDRTGKELVLAIGDDRQFSVLCQVLGIPELAEKPEFKTNKARVLHRAEVNAVLAAQIQQQDRETFLQELSQRNVPAGAVYTIPEALGQPLVAGQLLPDEAGAPKGIRQVAFSGSEVNSPETLAFPPRLGQHTGQVLQEMAGLTPEQVQEMAQSGQIYLANP